jgi:hypothetical protein
MYMVSENNARFNPVGCGRKGIGRGRREAPPELRAEVTVPVQYGRVFLAAADGRAL